MPVTSPRAKVPGDDQTMVKIGPMQSLAHDRCVFEQLGEGIFNLPKGERTNFTLAAWAGHDQAVDEDRVMCLGFRASRGSQRGT
jgi:hypothetical protein